LTKIDQFRNDMDLYFLEYGWISQFYLEKYTEKIQLSSFHDALKAASQILEKPELFHREAQEIVIQEVCDSVAYAVEKLVISVCSDKNINVQIARNTKKFIGHKLVKKTDLVLMLREEWNFEIDVRHWNFEYTIEVPAKDMDRSKVLSDVLEYIVQQAEEACSQFEGSTKRKASRKPQSFINGYIVEHEKCERIQN